MAFAIHHSIHHDTIIKAIAAIGKTGLSLNDLPPNFGRSPGTIYGDLKQDVLQGGGGTGTLHDGEKPGFGDGDEKYYVA